MSNFVPILKDKDHQVSIPTEWRSSLTKMVDYLKDLNFEVINGMGEVQPLSAEDEEGITKNIELYGATLISLPDETWETSACQWMVEYWDVLVDLYTVEEGASDLALSVRVFENRDSFLFRINSVLVP